MFSLRMFLFIVDWNSLLYYYFKVDFEGFYQAFIYFLFIFC